MSNPFNVLHFYPFVGVGGAMNAMLTLVAEQERRGRTYVLTLVDEPHVRQNLGPNATIVAVVPGAWPRGRIARVKLTIERIVDAVREFKIDVIHNHSAAGNHYCVPAVWRTGTPLVSHHRENYRWNWSNFGLAWTDHIITVSDWIRRGLPPRLRKKATALLDATELPDVQPRAKAPGQRVAIGIAGRCFEIKGFDLVVDAALALMPRLDFDVHMWGMNDTEYSLGLEAKVAQSPPQVRERFHFQPFRADIENFYDLIDIAIVPSKYPDPFPRTVTEAMARYKCTITAGHGGMIEIVDNNINGLTFAPGDAADLARALERVLTDDALRNKLALEGRKAVETKLAAGPYADACDEVYRKVYEARHGARPRRIETGATS